MKRKNEIDTNGLNDLIHLSKNVLKIFYIIVILGVILAALLVCSYLKILPFLLDILGVIAPLIIGFVIAWLFYPLQQKLVKKGFTNGLSAITIFLGIIAFIFLFIYIFIPVLYTQVNDLVSYIPNIIESVTGFVTNFISDVSISGFDSSMVKEGISKVANDLIVALSSSLPNGVLSLIKGTISAIGTILLSLVISLYVLIDFDNIKKAFKKMLPKKSKEDYDKLLNNMEVNARRAVNGTLFVAFIVFICDSIGFSLIGLNSSVLFGLFCGLTDLIPYIGPYIGGAAAVIVGFTQSPIVGIGTLIIAVIVQLLESYVLQPMVMSKAAKLHPVMIIVGLLLFGHFFGIVGMIIATPCIVIIRELILFINRKVKRV